MFWRRDGGAQSRIQGPWLWVMRIVILLFVVFVVVLMFRLYIGGAGASQPVLDHALDAGWEDEKTCEALLDNEQLLVFKCAFAPDAGHEPHFHRPHFGYILEGGRMRVQGVGDGAADVREIDTETGATWWSGEATRHSALNISDQQTSYLIVEPKGAMNTRPDFQATLDAHIAAIAAKDLGAYIETITKDDDLQLIFPGGQHIATTEGVIDFHRDWFKDESWRFELETIKIEVGADMAFAFFKTRFRDSEDGAPREAWLTLVFGLEDGEWRLIHDQNTRIPAPEPTETEE